MPQSSGWRMKSEERERKEKKRKEGREKCESLFQSTYILNGDLQLTFQW